MKKLFAALAALALLASPAHAQKTKANMITEIGTNLPDNTTGLITPAILRTTLTDMVNSWYGLIDATNSGTGQVTASGYALSASPSASVLFLNSQYTELSSTDSIQSILLGVADAEMYLRAGNVLIQAGSGTGGTRAQFSNGTAGQSIFTLGVAGTYTGIFNITGSTSGTVTIQPQAAAGTWNFNLPTTAGAAGTVLTSQGGGSNAMTWSSAGSGTVTSITMGSGLTSTQSPLTTAGTMSVSLTTANNTLAADVTLSTSGTYFDGPSMAQGTTGTWWASGSVTLTNASNSDILNCKLWDGTTVIASAQVTISSVGSGTQCALSGFLTSPAANIRISVDSTLRTTSLIKANLTGNGADSTIYGMRIK